jgi:hypothetical protein
MENPNGKQCPACGEVIAIVARKCKHCGEFLIKCPLCFQETAKGFDTCHHCGGTLSKGKEPAIELNYYRLKAVGCIPAASRLKVLSNAKC